MNELQQLVQVLFSHRIRELCLNAWKIGEHQLDDSNRLNYCHAEIVKRGQK